MDITVAIRLATSAQSTIRRAVDFENTRGFCACCRSSPRRAAELQLESCRQYTPAQMERCADADTS